MRFLIILTFLVPFSVIAQPFQGQNFVGGSFSFFTSSSENDDKTTTFSFNPLLGGMMSDRMAFGSSLGFGFSKTAGVGNAFIDPITGQLSFSNGNSSTTTLSINPFLSWYFPIKENLGFNLLTGAGVGYNKRKIESSSISTTDFFQYSANISPALYYFISPNISLHATLGGLQFTQTTGKEVNNSTSFNFSIRSGSSFSIRYFWGDPISTNE